MSKNVGRASARVKRKSRTSLIALVVAALVVIVLLYLEQVALLYVLATLSVAGLLTVVALSDLKGVSATAEPTAGGDSAAISDRSRSSSRQRR